MRYKITFSTTLRAVEVIADSPEEAQEYAWYEWDAAAGEPQIESVVPVESNHKEDSA